MEENSIVILASEGLRRVAKRVYERLETDKRFSYMDIGYTVFANGEIKPEIPDPVRRKEVYLFVSMSHPDPNTACMKLFLTLDALSRASVEGVTLVLPYMSYTRQDRKDKARVPISARLIADIIETKRDVKRLMTMDLHASQEQGFYSIPVDNLPGEIVHREHLKRRYNSHYSSLVIVSPDRGGFDRADNLAKKLQGAGSGLINKRRTGTNQAVALHYIGDDVDNKEVILYDDMIDTGGSVIAAANMLRDHGAKSVAVYATHGLFSPTTTPAEEKFRSAGLEIVVTESIPRTPEYRLQHSWLTVLDIDELLARAIDRSTHIGGSISKIF